MNEAKRLSATIMPIRSGQGEQQGWRNQQPNSLVLMAKSDASFG